jgi:hypothetical protein
MRTQPSIRSRAMVLATQLESVWAQAGIKLRRDQLRGEPVGLIRSRRLFHDRDSMGLGVGVAPEGYL